MALAALPALAGPVEFGRAEFDRVLAERGLSPARYRLQTELDADPPECFRIRPGLITGGDLRGLMYGLLEAAEQIRETGRLRATRGAPATPIRGVRRFLHNADLEKGWCYSRTLEATGAQATFTIPEGDISPRWDLMYSFEVLNPEGSGWFEPDPAASTTYYVVTVE